MAPKVIARPDRGVLPVNANSRAPKQPAARLKLEIRRLPPGLTLVEFEEILGEEWRLGKGKVDWREYRQGKVKSPGKLPEQSRCYLHFAAEPLVGEFEARFLHVVFHDKAGTHKLPELRHLPPTLGFAPNQRTPLHAKQRVDNRQGTIDQDPEFIAFLEAETQPIIKPAAVENSVDKEREDVKSTPLIDDLRERKANKAKAAASKAEREKDKKKSNAKSKDKEREKEKDKDVAKEKDSKDVKTSQAKNEKTPKQGAKILTKNGAKSNAATPSQADSKTSNVDPTPKKNGQNAREKKGTAAQTAAASAATSSSPGPQRQRQRGNNLEGIKKQLHKDLGVKATSATAAAPASEKSTSKQQSGGDTPSQSSSRPVSRASNAPATNKASRKPQNQTPNASAAKAYLKHANPSQGITEVLIQQALSAYGELTNVTIDPRKGTAIAVFKDQESLKKAIEAKRVTVANGAVEVLEFKDRSGASSGGGGGGGGGPNNNASTGGGRGGARGGRGGRGGSRGGHNNAAGKGDKGDKTTSAASATSATPAPASTPVPAPAS